MTPPLVPTRPLLRLGVALIFLALAAAGRAALGEPAYVADASGAGSFPLAHAGKAAPLVVDAADWPGVRRAARDVTADLARVTGSRVDLAEMVPTGTTDLVLVGTLGRSPLIDRLVAAGKIDVTAIRGRWESFLSAVVEAPLPGVARALVIVGSDKRGTIYGLYDLSEQCGVSPWVWWADVPVTPRAELHVAAGVRTVGEPVVKYRGIFLNDEAPALTGWAHERFGGLNRQFYARVFELLLRLRANYLWPAMWNNAFNEDDPENPRLADEYGIVMGTSHHEPMIRSQQEWKKHGAGAWDYHANGEMLRAFWADGIRRNREFESLVTIGMRGDGDEPMSEESNVALLQQIVGDQRAILERETGRPAAEVPQLWALYKEVQDYFEKGMRVPDDVTLLWCDDNWGNLRRLPTAAERTRPGGAGVYYHFDYVGGPRNYKWLNTVPLTKIWEQMHLAWQHEANRIWIVNVGDLKPMEFPIEFFLRYAWDPARWPAGQLDAYAEAWAAREFGPAHAAEVAALIDGYTRLNGLRKPEMLAPDTFSLIHERESERIVAAWRDLRTRAAALRAQLPALAHSAFVQLVQHPIDAGTVVNELHQAAGLNHLYAQQGRASANAQAARARALFAEDAALTQRWDELAGGRWRHFMAQTHLGYTGWQQPVLNVMPAVVEVQPRAGASLAVAVEGDPAGRPGDYPVSRAAQLPPLHAFEGRTRWIEVFNRGTAPVAFTVESSVPWLALSATRGELGPDVRIEVGADWPAVPVGDTTARVTVRPVAGGPAVPIDVPVRKPAPIAPGAFVETGGVVALEAPHFTRAVAGAGMTWQVFKNFGRAVGGVTAFPVLASAVEAPGGDSPRLEYAVELASAGAATLRLVAAPTQAYAPGRGLRCAVSLDDGTPQLVDLLADRSGRAWERMVGDGVNQVVVRLNVPAPGRHTLKVWFVDPGVVWQRFVLDFGGAQPTYLGPRESPRAPVSRP